MATKRFLLFFLLTLFIVSPGPALAQTPFYQGKTVTIVQGRDPGGTGDMRVRAMLPFLQKHIPGNPTIVNEYVPGGGSRKAANHVYKSVRPDGLTIGNLGLGMVSSALLGEPGSHVRSRQVFVSGFALQQSSRHLCKPEGSRSE